MFDKLQQTFSDIGRNLAGKSRISEKNIEETVEQIKMALLDADVNLRVVRRFINATAEEARGEKVLKSVNPGQQFIKIVYDRMVSLLGDERQNLALRGPDVTSVILLVGLQGSGKTTSAAKMANMLKKEGRRPLLVACDLTRPAAVEQLRLLGEQIEVPVFIDDQTDPLKRAEAAIKLAKKEQYNVVIIDSAGRMQLDEALMAEIKSIAKHCDPVEKILVADSMTGQNAVEIASVFHETLGLTGVILSKFDSDTRGGAALSLKSVTGQPIKFIGTGEKVDNFEPFYPDRIASRILGMGDVVSLVEKAQEAVNEEEAMKLQAKILSATFSLNDYLEQMRVVKKMGKAGELAKLLPGVSSEELENNFDEKAIVREEAMILSMTLKERINPLILNPSRRRRIAKGAGVTPVDLNRFLNRFEKIKLQMKKLGKNKTAQAKIMQGLGKV
jgi:signal recognition particle subunit SRP54